MKVSEIRNLTDEELFELSLQKGRKGNATCDAKIAQKIIWERGDKAFNGCMPRELGDGNSTSKRYKCKERNL